MNLQKRLRLNPKKVLHREVILMPKPVIDESKCTGCKTSVEICPMQVFEFDEESKKAKSAKPAECIGCRACEVQCEDGAIKVED